MTPPTPTMPTHNFLPTPTCGKGGTKDGNHNFQCQRCSVKVTKAQLINDEIPARCRQGKSR